VSVTVSEEQQTVFEAVSRFVNYIRKSSLRGRLSAKLCDAMEAEYMALLHHCETRWLSRAEVLYRIFEMKKKLPFV
jgi:hypothetical protein